MNKIIKATEKVVKKTIYILVVGVFIAVYCFTPSVTHATLGTNEHLELIKDIYPGSADSNPGEFVAIGDTMYFTTSYGQLGQELWRSDGTSSGTSIVKDINPGAGDGSPLDKISFNNSLFFFANDGTHGNELWKSDGTEGGTQMVKDINAGSGDGVSTYLAYPNGLYEMNGYLYFTANDGTHGNELWKSDGTEGGTQMVKDIQTGSGSSMSQTSYETFSMAVYSDQILFSANDGTHGNELWKSDGTEGGTQMVKDINVGSSNSIDSYYISIVSLDNGVMFIATDGTGYEPWFSDGTSIGTIRPVDINTSGDSIDFFGSLTKYNNSALFSAYSSSSGYELWTSDGTTIGTHIVKDINPGAGDSRPDRLLTVFNNYQYFRADDGTHGKELWKTDGTEIGTTMVADILVGSDPSYANPIAVVNNELFVIAADTFEVDPDTYVDTSNFELWRTDGTAEGTSLVSEINPTGQAFPAYFSGKIGNRIFFDAYEPTHGNELWSYWVDTPTGDTDNDGILDTEETSSPNSGDANDDGTQDSEQADVTSYYNPVSSSYSALESTCTSVTNVQVGAETGGSLADIAYDYPAGLTAFHLNCDTHGATATVAVYYYGNIGSISNLVQRKWSNSYTTIPGAVFSTVTIGGQNVIKVVYQITDGGELDEDGVANGVIVDPSGPGLNVVGVPNTGLLKTVK